MLTNVAINETKDAENHIIGSKSGKYLKCFWPKCLFKTLDSRGLKDHYSVHQKTKNQFKCDVNNCQKVFKYKQNLIQHRLSHRSQTNTKGFTQKLPLIGRNGPKNGAHLTRSDENGKNGHKSGLIFAHKSNVLLNSTKMTANIQTNNTSATGLTSGQVFGQKTANTEAKRTQLYRKPKDKRFVCDYSGCDKCFDSKSNLERHKRIHSGEKPFGCDIPGCGQRFTQKTHLVQHKKRKHRIILPKNAIKLIKPDGFDETPTKSPAEPALNSPNTSVSLAAKTAVNSAVKAFVSTPKHAVNSPIKPLMTSTPKVANNSTKTGINSSKTATNSTKPVSTPKPSVNSTKPSVNTSAAKTPLRTPLRTPLKTPLKTSLSSSSANKSMANSSKTVTNTTDKCVTKSEPTVLSADKQYKCYYSKCQYSYDSLYELKTHVNSVHTNEALNKCHEINCNEVFKSFYNLYYHKKTFHKLV